MYSFLNRSFDQTTTEITGADVQSLSSTSKLVAHSGSEDLETEEVERRNLLAFKTAYYDNNIRKLVIVHIN